MMSKVVVKGDKIVPLYKTLISHPEQGRQG